MIDTSNKAVAQRILAAMKEAGVTPAPVAREAGVSIQSVRGWINTGKINRENLAIISHLCGYSLDWLITGHEYAPAGVAESIPPTYAGPRDQLEQNLMKKFRGAEQRTRDAVQALLGTTSPGGVDKERLTLAIEMICRVKDEENAEWTAEEMARLVIEIYNELTAGRELTRSQLLDLCGLV